MMIFLTNDSTQLCCMLLLTGGFICSTARCHQCRLDCWSQCRQTPKNPKNLFHYPKWVTSIFFIFVFFLLYFEPFWFILFSAHFVVVVDCCFAVIFCTCHTLLSLVVFCHLLWPPYVIGGPLYYCPVISFYLSSSFFIPRLISAAAGWMSTILWHMVWP